MTDGQNEVKDEDGKGTCAERKSVGAELGNGCFLHFSFHI